MKRIGSKLALALLAGGLGFVATGCVSTFKEVKPLTVGPLPATKPTALAVGKLTVKDARLSETEQQLMAHAFALGMEKWFAEHKGLELLKNVAATNVPIHALVLNGTITEVEKGSAAARFWVGMGAGQERAAGEFALHNAEGKELASFTARKSYLGGNGIGGFDMLKPEDLVDQLGQLVAETADKWIREGKIR